MLKIRGSLLSAALAAALTAGCGKSTETSGTPNPTLGDTAAPAVSDAAALEPPAAAVRDFLEALRSGNDDKAAKMLSTVAREKTASLNRNVTPPASDTAKFSVGKVEYIGEDGARVACTWTDLDEQGQAKTDQALWVARREAEGWRIAGVAATIFPGEPPLLLNFEDPDDMFRKQQWVREEIRRRSELQADEGEAAEKPLRR